MHLNGIKTELKKYAVRCKCYADKKLQFGTIDLELHNYIFQFLVLMHVIPVFL